MATTLTFWQNIPSIHQAPLIREVANLWSGPVRVITEADVSARRRQQGWSRPDFGDAKLIVAPGRLERQALLSRLSNTASTHLLSGINAYPETYWTLKQLAPTGAIIGVMVEPGRHDDGIKALLRRVYHKSITSRWRDRLDLLLATGQAGCAWWRNAGFDPGTVVPFGYFVECAGDVNVASAPASGQAFRLIYVGAINHNKALDILLKALATVTHNEWTLDIIGTGPLEQECTKLISQYGMVDRVHWHGNLSNRAVLNRMATADSLILPSRFDGWGAVVNEALSVGTPVIVSDACGAKDLLGEVWRGDVFPSEDVQALAAVLRRHMASTPVLCRQRERIRAWSLAAISPVVAAQYLIMVLEAIREQGMSPVTPPWMDKKADAYHRLDGQRNE